MEQEKLNEILMKHELWLDTYGEQGEQANLSNMDLSGATLIDANLRYAKLRGADLCDVDLRGANLGCADLRWVDLIDANLVGADLHGTNLRNANLRYADLTNVNLRSADLRNADLTSANLRYADLRYADLRYTDLHNADLDFSCFPLWCGGLDVLIDDKQAIQLLYHLLRNVKNSENTSEEIKRILLTRDLIDKANEFHRVDECGFLGKEV